jgi:hypothetical protein
VPSVYFIRGLNIPFGYSTTRRNVVFELDILTYSICFFTDLPTTTILTAYIAWLALVHGHSIVQALSIEDLHLGSSDATVKVGITKIERSTSSRLACISSNEGSRVESLVMVRTVVLAGDVSTVASSQY